MSFISNPSNLDDLGLVLIVLGMVGQVSLFFFPADRRTLERSLAVLFTVVVAGGMALAWKASLLRLVDRELKPAQQVMLERAIAQFPGISYEVMASRNDREADALAGRILDGVRASGGSGTPTVEDLLSRQMGVILLVRDREAPAGRALEAIGRALMAARIAAIVDVEPSLDPNTIRVVVGRKP